MKLPRKGKEKYDYLNGIAAKSLDSTKPVLPVLEGDSKVVNTAHVIIDVRNLNDI